MAMLMTCIMAESVKKSYKKMFKYEVLKNDPRFARIWRHRWREQRGDAWVDIDRVAKLKSKKILGNSRKSQKILENVS